MRFTCSTTKVNSACGIITLFSRRVFNEMLVPELAMMEGFLIRSEEMTDGVAMANCKNNNSTIKS